MSNGMGIVKLACVAVDAQLAFELADSIVSPAIILRFFGSERNYLISVGKVDFSIIALRVSNFSLGSITKLIGEFT